jgi:hypothetical protein
MDLLLSDNEKRKFGICMSLRKSEISYEKESFLQTLKEKISLQKFKIYFIVPMLI